MLKLLLREPLVQFLLLGAVLFVLDAWLRPAAAPVASTEIVVSETRIDNLAQNFRRTWQRPPTRQELDGLIEAFVKEEVMVREALALGLDRDDAIIRRRLQQKMEFVSEEAAASVQPTDEELAKYLAANADAFRVEGRVSFTQVYLDPRRRAATRRPTRSGCSMPLNSTRRVAPTPRSWATGCCCSSRGTRMRRRRKSPRLFGAEFAEALVKQPVGQWIGPIASGYGAAPRAGRCAGAGRHADAGRSPAAGRAGVGERQAAGAGQGLLRQVARQLHDHGARCRRRPSR